EAEKVFQEIIRQDPQHADAHFYTGWTADVRGSLRDAEGLYETTLRLQPGHVGAQERLTGLRRRVSRTAAWADRQDLAGSGAPQPGYGVSSAPLAGISKAPSAAPRGAGHPQPAGAPMPAYGAYEYMLQDSSPISVQTLAMIDALRTSGRPRLTAYLGHFVHAYLTTTVVLFVVGTLVLSIRQ